MSVPNPFGSPGPVYEPPPESSRSKRLEFIAAVIGGTFFVLVPAVWIIYVMLQHFEILPK
jgi:hypothetical protein